jgi:hypothetical protein
MQPDSNFHDGENGFVIFQRSQIVLAAGVTSEQKRTKMLVVDRAFVVPPIAVSLKPRTKLAIEPDPIRDIFGISTDAFPPDPSQSFALIVARPTTWLLARDC